MDQPTSQSLNLTYASDDTFILRADYTTVLDPSGPGRDSVRIRSWNSYTQHVAVCVFFYISVFSLNGVFKSLFLYFRD